MAWGDYVQHTTNGYSNRTSSNSFEDISLTGVKKDSAIILLFIARSSVTNPVVTAAQGSNTPPVRGFPKSPATGAISRGFMNAWYINPADIDAGNITVRVAWSGGAPSYSDIGLFEIEADNQTELEMTGVLVYAEDPLITAPHFTESKETFSLFAGYQQYDGGNHVSTDLTFHDWVANMGSFVVSPSGRSAGASVFVGSHDTWTYLHEAIDMSPAAGASVEGDGVMLVFGRDRDKMNVPADTALNASTLYRVATGTQGIVSGSTNTITLSAKTVAVGDIELLVMCPGQGYGAIVTDGALDQGWTYIGAHHDGGRSYYKVATTTTEAAVTWTWSGSSRPGYAYAAYRLGGALLSVSSASTSVNGGFTLAESLTELSREAAGRRVWFAIYTEDRVVGANAADTASALPARTWAQGASATPTNLSLHIYGAVIDASGYPEAAGCVYADYDTARLSAFDGYLATSVAFLSWGVETDPLPGDGAGPLYVRRHVGAQAVPYTLRRSDLEDVPWHEAYPQARATLPGRSERSALVLPKS